VPLPQSRLNVLRGTLASFDRAVDRGRFATPVGGFSGEEQHTVHRLGEDLSFRRVHPGGEK
jgi:hypothetical protein